MIDFNEIKYERISFNDTREYVNGLIKKLKECTDFKKYVEIIEKINAWQNHIEEMNDYADIRNMRDMSNEYWAKEIEYWNGSKAKFDNLFGPFYNELLNSKFTDKLALVFPPLFFKVIKNQGELVSNKNIELIKKENELKMQYRALSKNSFEFAGELTTINKISKLCSSNDRETRKKAHDAVNDFYYCHSEEYKKILFELIKVRNEIANNLGLANYVDYSLIKLKRFDYNYDDIQKFRDSIINYIIPVCYKLKQCQKQELNISNIMYYDTVFFKDMPKLKFEGQEMLNELYSSFLNADKELAEIFKQMFQNNYIDLLSNDNKVNFGITNYLVETKMPVITGNFKKNYLDLQTATHEMGHAFQKYCASEKEKALIVSPLLKYPTMEVAEMFSYGMELIMTDYVNNLFDKNDYKKYVFMKIYNLIFSLPYTCAVDEFQELIYSKKDLKLEDINKIWLDVTKKYQLNTMNKGHINLESGGYYYRQNHIYLDPFYYIDYALSYFGALSLWDSSKDNLEVFKRVGSVASFYSLKELINKYNISSPFDSNKVKDLSRTLEKKLDSIKKDI